MAGREYLTYGRLWGPVVSTAPMPSFTEDSFGWGMYEKLHAASLPCAEARLWQAEDGQLAVFMANYVDQEIPFTFVIDPAAYGLESDAFRLNDLSPRGTRLITRFSGPIEHRISLPAGGLKAIEIVPNHR